MCDILSIILLHFKSIAIMYGRGIASANFVNPNWISNKRRCMVSIWISDLFTKYKDQPLDLLL